MFRPPNPFPELLFTFRITPLTRFKQAIHTLIDQDFNPNGFGILEVREDGVEFTAQNVVTKATGVLGLHSAALQNFYINRRCQERIMRISFRQIEIRIKDTDVDGSITFFRFAGSNNVTIQIGINPVREFPLRIISMVLEFERLQDTSFCAAMLPSTMLREMINRFESGEINELVSASLSQVLFLVYTGNLPLQPLEHYFNDGADETMGMVPGQVHHAWFIWHHLDALRNASHIDPNFVISFSVEPREMVMTLHSLQHLGYLMMMFSNRATKILPNINSVPPEVATAVAAAATAAAAAEVPMFDFRN